MVWPVGTGTFSELFKHWVLFSNVLGDIFFFFNAALGSLLKHLCWPVFRFYLDRYAELSLCKDLFSLIICIAICRHSNFSLNAQLCLVNSWILVLLSPSLPQSGKSLKAVSEVSMLFVSHLSENMAIVICYLENHRVCSYGLYRDGDT